MKKLGIQLLIMFAVVQVYAANYHIKWTQVTGATYDLPTYTITKNVNNSWNNCGAISSNYLKANTDGKVEFVVNNLTEKKAFGLSQYNTSPGLASLDYALYINEGKLFIIENGAILGRYGNVALNDIVYIERVGSIIYYRQNKTTLRQVTTNPANILYADITIFAQGSSFNSGITASFAVDMSVTYDLVHVNCVTNTRGSISANITGGEAPFTYNWTTVGTSSQITDLKIGKYGVLINDYLGQVFKADFEIFNTTFWNNPIGANFSNDYFTKNTTDGWDNCGGISYNGLNSGENGYITLKIDNTIGNKAIGLSNYSSQTGYLDINYCFFINGPKLDIVESGIVQGTFGTLAGGDIVSIELNSGTIFYYLNGKEIRKVVESSSKKLFAKFSIYNQGETLEPVHSSFCFPEIELQSSNVHGQAYCSENVTLIPIGGYPPYSYLWSDGNTSQVRQDVTVGKYDITVSDNYSHSNHNMVAVNTMVQWTDLVGTTLSGEKLVKTGTDGWGTGGAASLNKLYSGENGFLTYTINHLGDVFCLGLSSVNTDANYTTINYGFMVDGSGKILIYENGEMKIPVSIAKAGDVLKIEKSGLDIKYYYNDKNVLTTNLKNNTGLIVDVALLKTNAYLDPVYVSFCPKPEIITDYTVSFNEDCNLGYVDLEVTGGVAPFTYLWSTGETTQDYSNKQGSYYVTVTDFAGTQKVVTVKLFPDIVWTDLVGVELQGDRLVKTAIKDWGNGGAASENMLFADQNGYIVYTVNENNPKSFGLSPNNRDAGYMSIEYSFYVSRNGYEIIERGTLIGNYGKYTPGDQLKIEKYGRRIKYWVNSKLVRESIINDPVNYIADVALFEMGSYFEELYVSFCIPPLGADLLIVDVENDIFGSIQVYPYGGKAPYKILLNSETKPEQSDINRLYGEYPFIASIEDNSESFYNQEISILDNTVFNSLKKGNYQITVFDNNNDKVSLPVYLGNQTIFNSAKGVDYTKKSIKKVAPDGWGNGVITDYNILPLNSNSIIRFKVNTTGDGVFGLRNTENNQAVDYQGITGGVYLNNGVIKTISNGIIGASIGQYQAGDVIEMKMVTNNVVNILKNGSVAGFVSLAQANYYTDFVLYSNALELEDVSVDLEDYNFGFFNSIDDASCLYKNSGAIDVTFNFLFCYNIEFHWTGNNVIIGNQDQHNLYPGQYSLEIQYDNVFNPSPTQLSVFRDYEVGYEVYWKNITNLEQTNINTLTRNSAGVDYLSNAVSSNHLPNGEDGWAEFTVKVNDMVHSSAFGFTQNDNIENLDDIENGIVLLRFNLPYFNINNICVINNGVMAIVGLNDNNENTFRIERIGNTINYYKNSSLIYSVGSTSSEINIGTFLISQNSSLIYTRSSFECEAKKDNYTELSKKIDGGYYLVEDNLLKFKYVEEYNPDENTELNYKIFEINALSVVPEPVNFTNDFVHYGDNRYAFDVSGLSNGHYLMEVSNQKSEKWYLRFKIQ